MLVGFRMLSYENISVVANVCIMQNKSLVHKFTITFVNKNNSKKLCHYL